MSERESILSRKKRVLAKREISACMFVYILLSALTAWLFYDCIYLFPVFFPFFFLFTGYVARAKENKQKEELTEGFLRALISVAASITAGMSPENAFITAGHDMEKLYGTSPVIGELNTVNSQVRTGIRLEDALSEMAERSGIAEMYDFAVVFRVAKQNGSDFPSVISSCVDIMETKRQTECEAKVMIRSKQYEQRIMCVIPPGILLYLRLSSGGFIRVLYHNPSGIAVMTACLAVYVIAICLAEKIGDIRL